MPLPTHPARWYPAVLACLLLLAATAGAQTTVSVEADDPVLARIDRLIAEGAIRTAIVGQRPYSRREVVRLRAEARATADSLATVQPEHAARIRALLALDSARFATPDGMGTQLVERASVEAVGTGDDARTIPFGGTGMGPLGRIDAITDPLVERRLGRIYARGATFALETAHRVQLGSHAAFAISPRAWTRAAGDPVICGNMACPLETDLDRERPRDDVVLRTAALTVGARNVRVTIGRDYQLLGQSMFGGGLMISDNAPALDMIRVASDAPFRLPWILRRLGPMQATAYLADLGGGPDVDHPKLAGWKVSFLASPRLEWGAAVQSEQGGRGAPGASAAQRVADLIPLIDVLALQDRDLLFSNKLAGLEARVRIPELRGLELYWEGAVDDFDIRRVGSSLTEDGAHVLGAAVTRLTGTTNYRLDVEARYTGLRLYQHEQFPEGLTNDRFIIGDPIGPRARGLAARISRDPGGHSPLLITWALERRSDDQYVVNAEEGSAEGWEFIKVEDRPEEIRNRVVLTWLPALPPRALTGRLDLGWEHVRNWAFSARTHDSPLLRVGLDARF